MILNGMGLDKGALSKPRASGDDPHHPSNLRDDVSEIQVQVAQTREQLAHLTDMFVAGQQASAARDDALRSSVDSINARSERTHDAIFSRLRDIESGRGRRVRKD